MRYSDSGPQLARAERLSEARHGQACGKLSKRRESAMVQAGRDAHVGNEQQFRGHQLQMYSRTTRRMRPSRLVARSGCGSSLHSTPPVGNRSSTSTLGFVIEIRRRSAAHCSWRSVGRIADEARATEDTDETRGLVRPQRQFQSRQVPAPTSGSSTVRGTLPVDRLGCCAGRTKTGVREHGKIIESTVDRSGRVGRSDRRKEFSKRRARESTSMHYIAHWQSATKGTTAFRKDADRLSVAIPDVSARWKS